ncbi:MAG: 6-hydroxymethylpterin diphosphokinase MptE-like protein [Solirubrobacteraceae bacterium]
MTSPAAITYWRRRAVDAAWWHTPPGRRCRDRLAGLRQRYAGRRCFIIGNGPSLQLTDVSRIKGEVSIGSNSIFLLFEETGFMPTFLTVEDNLVAEDRADTLNAVRGPTKIFPRDLSYCLVRDDDTVYVNFIREYDDFPRFSDRFDQFAYWGGTVSFLNLQLAYHLGCNPIYLIGFDHSYSVPSVDESAVITSDADDQNHFHPDYFGKGMRWHDPQVPRMERSLQESRRFLESRGTTIANATAGGKLEVFDRVDYDQLVRGPA